MAKVAVLDYGVGNLFSMSNALERAGLKVKVTREPEEIASANAIVLPGWGISDQHQLSLSSSRGPSRGPWRKIYQYWGAV